MQLSQQPIMNRQILERQSIQFTPERSSLAELLRLERATIGVLDGLRIETLAPVKLYRGQHFYNGYIEFKGRMRFEDCFFYDCDVLASDPNFQVEFEGCVVQGGGLYRWMWPTVGPMPS